MALAKSCFSGSRIINLTPCTSSEGRLCHIFREISLWNEYFWQVHLELRELSPGCLSLVQKHKMYVGAYANIQAVPEQMHAVATLLHHLLTGHHCVSSVAIYTSVSRDYHQLICDALCKSPSLTKLKLYAVRDATHPPGNIATALLHLNHMRELELQGMPLDRNFIDGLSDFLESTRSLTALTVRGEHFDCEEDAVAFVQGLGWNRTITTLSFDMMLLGVVDPLDRRPGMPVSSRYAAVFAGYLRRNKTLRTLSMRGCRLERSTDVARPIFEALIKNNTLTKVTLTSLSLEYEVIELISSLLSQNRTLTTFSMTRCRFHVVHSQVSSYLAAFTVNRTLEELTLDFSRFNTNEYRSLFRALASNPTLKKVTVEQVSGENVAEMCRAVRETNARERFFVGTHSVIENTVDALTECKELSSVEVQSQCFNRSEPLLTTLSLLPSCSQVTSLGLALRPDEFSRASSLIAQCITGMAALRKLKLAITRGEIGVAFNMARQELAQALSLNKTIRRLTVYGALFGDAEIEMLADRLQSSRTLCEMFFFPQRLRSVMSLMRKLSPNISGNYTLLDMRFDRPCKLDGDWFTVADVLRRNCSLVTRAAHFVVGTRLNYCAAAVEQVHSNPGLVEKVRELASVDEDEAASLIKKSLKSFSELDEFMRVAGVVKYGVTCRRRDDGKMQLVDIGRDCWLYLRQYIKVGDILDEQ